MYQIHTKLTFIFYSETFTDHIYYLDVVLMRSNLYRLCMKFAFCRKLYFLIWSDLVDFCGRWMMWVSKNTDLNTECENITIIVALVFLHHEQPLPLALSECNMDWSKLTCIELIGRVHKILPMHFINVVRECLAYWGKRYLSRM